MIRTLVACGFVLALLAIPVPEAWAQTSCAAWNAKCKGRCKEAGAPAGCPSYCARQMSACKTSGCWQEGTVYGGAKHCKLKKS